MLLDVLTSKPGLVGILMYIYMFKMYYCQFGIYECVWLFVPFVIFRGNAMFADRDCSLIQQ